MDLTGGQRTTQNALEYLDEHISSVFALSLQAASNDQGQVKKWVGPDAISLHSRK